MSQFPAPSPARALLGDAFGSFGKVVAAVTGAGVFLYLIGVGVLWQRLAAAGLQQQEVVAVIPREQLAVLGAREALLSAIAGALFALFLYLMYRLFRLSQQVEATAGVRGFCARCVRERPALTMTVILGLYSALFVPLDTPGVLFLVLFLANIYLGFRSAHRSLIGELPDFRASIRPWLRVALGLAIAVFLVSISRQSQFPDAFPRATIKLGEGGLSGQYLGSTSDAIVIGIGPDDQPKTKIVPRDSVKLLTLSRGAEPDRRGESLLRQLGVPLECLAPVCRWRDDTFNLLEAFRATDHNR